jgi:hypothetical protein
MAECNRKQIPNTISKQQLIEKYLPLLYANWREDDLQAAILHVQNLPEGTKYYNPYVPHKDNLAGYRQDLSEVLYWASEISGDVIFVFGFSDKDAANFSDDEYLFLHRLELETGLRFIAVVDA